MTIALAIVVPCFNEQEVLPGTAKRLLALLDQLEATGRVADNSALYFVDDGSTDATWGIIQLLASKDSRVRGVKLSKNCGHQNALLAGMSVTQEDAVVTLDADLQDDIAAIDTMLERFSEGYEIVYGVRKSRNTDTAFKRGAAQSYYRFLKLLGVEIVYNHADFRLMSRRAATHLLDYSEVNLFLRGIVPLLGFKGAIVPYDRTARFAGESKYSLTRSLGLALDGITSFSITPLRCIAVIGCIVFMMSFLMIGWVLYGKLFMNTAIPGWASSVIPIYFLGGIQLLSIGVVGEYLAKIYMETKRRPRYVIERLI